MTKKKANPGKRGAKPHYTGSRQEFLEQHLDEYISLKYSSRGKFWFRVFAEWWAKYPWKLDDKVEPPLDDEARMAELASAGPEEAILKADVETVTVARIKNWFGYQLQVKVSGSGGNPWFPLIQRLHECANRKPCKRSVVQQFMHEEPSLIDIEFARHYGSTALVLEGVERMNKHFEFSKILLTNQYSDRIPDLEKRAREEHERELAQWSLSLGGIQLAPDVDAARDSMFSIAHSLLSAMGSYSGCFVTLIAGAAPSKPGESEYFSAVHYVPDGLISRKNWTEWDIDGFRTGVARPFKKYIRSLGATAATPAGSDVVPPVTDRPLPPSQPSTITAPNVVVASKRTATGSRKSHSVVGSESEEWSDHSTDSEDVPQKRQRTDPIVTRSNARFAENARDSEHGPLSGRTAVHLPNNDVDASGTRSPGKSNPTGGADQATKGPAVEGNLPREDSNSHLPAGRTSNASSNAEPPTITDDPDVVTTTSVDVGLQALAITEIPRFLSITPKKSKSSIYSYFATCQEPHFQTLLHTYISFEVAAETLGQSGSLSTAGRPSQISWWVRSAHVDATPSWTSVRDYGSSVVAWWISLQPEWRKLKCGIVNRSDGPFDSLSQPGINGLLNIVVLAYWWSGGLDCEAVGSDVERSKYLWFVADVTWVLAKLRETA